MSGPSRDPTSPRLARRLLALVLPRENRDAILADLDDFHLRRVREGAGGRLWYWWQVLAYVVRRPQLRGRGPDGELGRRGRLWSPADALEAGRRAARALVRSPVVTVPAVLTIALAVGVNTAVFAVVDELLFAPLPYPDADELVQVWMEDPAQPDPTNRYVSPNAYRSWTEGLRGTADLGAFQLSLATLLGVGDPQDVVLGHAEPHLMERLGPDPVLGRSFTTNDAPEGTPMVLLAHAFWRTRLGADPDVVGRSLNLAGQEQVVVGVARAGFRLPLDREVAGWTALEVDHGPGVMGDLPTLTTLAWPTEAAPGSGDADPARLRERLQALLPAPAAGDAVRAYSELDSEGLDIRTAALETLARPTGTTLPILLGAVSLVLLMACLNVAQLLLARGVARGPELGVRLALGASSGALGRSLAAEAALLTAGGALLGTGVAAWTLHVFLALDPGHLPGWADARITPRVGIYLALVALTAAVVSGLLPALYAARTAPADLVTRRGSPRGRGSSRAQRGLLTVQTATTLVLLAGMAVLVRSWVAIQAVDPGFDPEDVHTARIVLPFDRYDPGDGAAHIQFFEELRRRLEDHPRIAAATVTTGLPLAGGLDFPQDMVAEGDVGPSHPVSRRGVSPGYFETLSVRVLAGRSLEPTDDAETESVVVLNRSAVRLLFGTDDPDVAVGRRIVEAEDEAPEPSLVVGVVEDQKELGPDHAPEPWMFDPWLQSRPFGRMWVAVRPAEAGASVWSAVRSALRDVDPALPLVDAAPLTERLSATTAPRRFSLVLVLTLGALSLVIAVVGMVGLAAFVASRGRREVAVRVALGAGSARALAPAVAPSLLSVVAGLALGLVGVMSARHVLRSLVFGVEPLDPASLAAAVALMAAVATSATLVPAWWAGRADPREVLDA